MRQRAFCPVACGLISVVLAVTGCSSGTVTPSPTLEVTPVVTPSPTATPTPTPTPTPSPTPSPVPSPEFVQTGSGIEYQAGDGTTLAVPEIPGLVASLAGSKVTYAALASNPYGLKAGAYAGWFNPDVSEQQQDGSVEPTGGVGLVPAVVSKLMQAKMSATPRQADKWIIPIPLAGATSASDIKITYVPNTFNVTMAEVDFSGDLQLTNPFLLSKQVAVSGNAHYGMSLFDYYRFESADNAKTFRPGQEAHYVAVYGDFDGLTPSTKLAKVFGDEVCTISSTVYLTYSDSTTYLPVDRSKILHVAPAGGNPSAPEVPVFLEGAKAPA